MMAVFCSSTLSTEELEKRAKEEEILLLNPKKINSEEELLLAGALAKSAFAHKRNIAKKREAEFLLWLSAKTNIKSAFDSHSFKNPKELLLISFCGSQDEGREKPRLIELFKMKEEKHKLKVRATPAEIERISLSRL